MRTIKNCLFLFLFLSLPATVCADDLGLVRLSLADSDVQVLIKDTTDWSAATVNLPLGEGDRLWAPENNRAELQIRGDAFLRLEGNSALDILTISNDSAQFYLDQGHVYINNRRGGIGTVQIDTPYTSVRGYDNSILLIDVSEEGVTEVSVLKGYAIAESKAGASRVAAGTTLTLGGESAGGELAPVAAPDDWERWNVERDRSLDAWSESSRYLPDELHGYASDFDQNGTWIYVSAYGYVWTPTVVMTAWAPYSTGSWVWIRGQYVWIDYDPWCWAPSHYGRWIFISGYGWCWVPPVAGAVYWGPGYVGWIVTTTYVAWVPLAPGEIYYGYGYYGPWSRNVTVIDVRTVNVNRTYVNATVPNSVVVVGRDGFGSGNRPRLHLKENPFAEMKERLQHNLAIVPPEVRPRLPIVLSPGRVGERSQQRRTMPEKLGQESAGRTQPGKMLPPPDRFRSIRPSELKRERPLVRERDASAFQRKPPENLPVRKLHEPKVIRRKPTLLPKPATNESIEQRQGRPEGLPNR